ncbi:MULTISPECIES: hypothetical protein [Sphingobium]|jgi:hypothetical protein|nr:MULTISPECIES: hypothetical protein [Sphingobium]MBU0933087.1 hypothetical protein [Alphaproteobacteria bacterium]
MIFTVVVMFRSNNGKMPNIPPLGAGMPRFAAAFVTAKGPIAVEPVSP